MVTTNQQKQSTETKDYYAIGLEFEKYVIELFNKDYFMLLDWQFAKKRDDISHLDLNFPDLYMVFGKKKLYRFAVECKYVSSVEDGLIKWADESNLRSYSLYQSRFRIPVFIAIGIGGTPSAPEKMFVTPFQNLESITHVYEHELYEYRRKPTRKFFLNIKQMELF